MSLLSLTKQLCPFPFPLWKAAGKGWEHAEPRDCTRPSKTPTFTAQGPLTLFAFQGHPGLQVVHLQLEAFQGAVSIPGLAFVGDEDNDDDEEEQTTPAADPYDGRQGEQAVRVDLQCPWGELKPSSLDLHHGGRKNGPGVRGHVPRAALPTMPTVPGTGG